MNRSVYSDLQSQIDRQRQFSAALKTPQKRKIGVFQNEEQVPKENFTDISKIKPQSNLAPIEFKNKINLDIPGTIPFKPKDIQKSNSHTTAFLYSKIGGRPKVKRSIIMQAVPEEPSEDRKSKFSLQHKSTASSLIATLGQRDRTKKMINSSPFTKASLSGNS